MVDRTVALAADAYVFGFPLVFNLEQVHRLQTGRMGGMRPAPYNTFVHATEPAGPRDTFVSVNNDTLYSMAYLDMSGGPLRLTVPDAAGAYYVLQFVDAWTNNVAYVGTRATGTDAAEFLLVPPGWTGTAPDGASVIPIPTMIAAIVGRTAFHGRDDLPRVRALQQGLRLAPLPGNGALHGIPAVPPDFFAKLRTWSEAFPPGPSDMPYMERIRSLPLTDPTAAGALAAGIADGQRQVETMSKGGITSPVNGWGGALHLFDYNIDFLGPGTRDDPRWTIPDRFTAYPVRAMAARVGLWGNHAYEAMYSTVYTDADGVQLNGAHRYRLRIETPPPVGAFWSLTMYDMPEYYLVDNPIDRYSIGDRTPGLRYGDDGSLTILMQHERSEDPNWLPAPSGDFRPMIRMYLPGDEILDGTYRLPPVSRVDLTSP